MKISNHYPSIDQMTRQLKEGTKTQNQLGEKISLNNEKAGTIPFHEVLKKQQETIDTKGLKFSKHANQRLASRNIDLTTTQRERLELGAEKAKEKGMKDTLIMVDDMAFIINVKNNTVITAVNDSDEKVFTNIDGAVII